MRNILLYCRHNIIVIIDGNLTMTVISPYNTNGTTVRNDDIPDPTSRSPYINNP